MSLNDWRCIDLISGCVADWASQPESEVRAMSTQTYPQGKPKQLSFLTATRVQQSFVAAAEKRTLAWLAERTPRRINSDHLTLLGFVAQCLAGVCYALAKWNRYSLLLGIVFLVLNWFGDSLDGTLARVRNCQRPRYGFYIDHILDAVGRWVLIGGLAVSGYISPTIAAVFLIVYLLLSIEIYLATYTVGVFHLSYWNFGPTELRILLIVGNLFALRR